MKQEVEIRGKRLLVMIAVLFIAVYIVLRKESTSTFMMVLVSMKIVIEGIFLFITCYRFVSILSAEWDEFFSYASVCEREVIGVGDDMAWMISEFASVGNVTVRTLRYYDKINLLKPSDYTEGASVIYER